MAEGVARLDHLIAHGASEHAFGWQQLPGAKLWKAAHSEAKREHAA
jgi:hypothetical protein